MPVVPVAGLIAPPDVIALDLVSRTAPEAIREMHARLGQVDGVVDPARMLDDLLARQLLAASCLDREIALPHTRTGGVTRVMYAVGRSAQGVGFDPEHPDIRLIFLAAGPSGRVVEYLHWTAQLVRLLRTSNVRETLRSATTADEVRARWPRPG
jgi:mannitol/fructose-specific phosphotransferase system IIA component (Ntr-type)